MVLPFTDIGGRQLLERHLLRASVRLRAAVESNSFEFLRGCLRHEQAVTFQIAIGAVTEGGTIVVRTIADRGFPSGQLVLAHLDIKDLMSGLPATEQQTLAQLAFRVLA